MLTLVYAYLYTLNGTFTCIMRYNSRLTPFPNLSLCRDHGLRSCVAIALSLIKVQALMEKLHA